MTRATFPERQKRWRCQPELALRFAVVGCMQMDWGLLMHHFGAERLRRSATRPDSLLHFWLLPSGTPEAGAQPHVSANAF